MDIGSIATLITLVLTVLGALAGGVLGYLIKGGQVAKEAGELMTAVGRAIEDKTVSQEELAGILKEYNDLKSAWNEISRRGAK